jgi:transcriptional regulator with XRE-family HTH domain
MMSIEWDAKRIRALRRHLKLTQRGLAAELGTRQQTISEWEGGMYKPRGSAAKLLTIVAESAGFEYQAQGQDMKIDRRQRRRGYQAEERQGNRG